MEPFCVVLYRHLSSKHPLNQILKYHCRGLLTTNTIGSPSLIKPDGYMDILTAMGHKGTIQLIGRAYEKLTWKDADFHSDMKVLKACLSCISRLIQMEFSFPNKLPFHVQSNVEIWNYKGKIYFHSSRENCHHRQKLLGETTDFPTPPPPFLAVRNQVRNKIEIFLEVLAKI